MSTPAQPSPDAILTKFDVQTSRIQGNNTWLVQLHILAAATMVQLGVILTPSAARALASNLLKQAEECETAIIVPSTSIPPSTQ